MAAKNESSLLSSRKEDIYQLYITKNKSLKDLMHIFHGIPGFPKSETRWKALLDKWGFFKNLSTPEMQYICALQEKRKREEGKDTISIHHGKDVSKKAERWKKRKLEEEQSNGDCPDYFTYYTPGPSHDNAAEKESNNEFAPSQLSGSETSVSSLITQLTEDSSAEPFDYVSRKPPIESLHLLDSQPMSTVDRVDGYLSNDEGPFSGYNLSRYHVRTDYYRNNVVPHDEMLEELEQLQTLDKIQSLPHRYEVDVELLLEFDRVVLDENRIECFGEISLELLDLSTSLLMYQSIHDGGSPEVLKKEFELAEALRRSGSLEEAENHCNKILSFNSDIKVQTFLGNILANTDRLTESANLLFSAIAGFIIQFGSSSTAHNGHLFSSIWPLFNVLNEAGWEPLESSLGDMMDTIQNAISEGRTGQITPQLVMHGFSLAQNCMLAHMTEPSGIMYRSLLEFAALYLDDISYCIEKAWAYREYATLLREDNDWKSSADQLLLAWECLQKSQLRHHPLFALLSSDFHRMRQHVGCINDIDDSNVEKINKCIDLLEHRKVLHDTSESAAAISIQQYLSPQNTLAVPSAIIRLYLNAKPLLDGPHLEGPHLEGTPSIRSGHCASSSSAKDSGSYESHPFGKTFTESVMTGMSLDYMDLLS